MVAVGLYVATEAKEEDKLRPCDSAPGAAWR